MSILFRTKTMNINSIYPDTSNYLQIVSAIAGMPKTFQIIGNLPYERLPTLAMVGTRKPTTYGREIGYRLAYDLAKQGVVIVSGLALGMDAIVHQAAVDAGGRTIAIMPGGLDRIYPASHRNLAIAILEAGGALISEYEPGTQIYPSNFIARNRIVTAISDGLLVVEATLKSGTMHTAGFALEQGKPVMAIPGNVTSATSEGCNNLIKTGARLVGTTGEVLEELGLGQIKQTSLPLGGNAQEQAILNLIMQGVRDGDQLQTASELAPAVFSQILTMLEIQGRIRPLGANKWGIRQ